MEYVNKKPKSIARSSCIVKAYITKIVIKGISNNFHAEMEWKRTCNNKISQLEERAISADQGIKSLRPTMVSKKWKVANAIT